MSSPVSSHPCTTLAPRIGGRRVFVSLTRDRNTGALRQIDVTVHKLGAPFREGIEMVMRLASELLGTGVSVATVADLLDARSVGGPGGDVQDLEGVTWARDVPSLVASILRRSG